MTQTSSTKQPLFRPLVPNLTAGLVTGFTMVIVAVSLASLIFSGPLVSNLPAGIGIALVTVVIHVTFTAFFASFDEAMSVIQDNPSVLLAVAAASLVGAVKPDASLFATVVVLILVTTLLTGATLWLVGHFGLGDLVRYIPYPVIGGFVAGTGWLLAQGSIGAMAGFPLTVATLPDLLRIDQILLWLPGVAFGLALFFGVQRFKHSLALPAILVCGLGLFYAALVLTGTSIETAIARGLLLGQAGSHVVWQLPVADLAQADWSAILGKSGNIVAIILLTVVSWLLNVSGLEAALRKDINLNYELRIAGIATLICGLAGGTIGYHSLSMPILSNRLGAGGRMAALVSGAVCLAAVVLGSSILAYLPKGLLGGLLLFLGLDFLNDWVVRGRTRLGRTDYIVVVLILLVIAAAGFLAGVGVGLVLTVVAFVVNYSRLNIFHGAMSGAEVESHVERNAYHRRALSTLGLHVYILELQGFIFFGTANALLQQIRVRLDDSELVPLCYLVVDFRRVSGVDSSAAFSLNKAKFLADSRNFTLVFTNLSEQAQCELARNGLGASEHVQVFSDLDHGLEWCENTLLAHDQVAQLHVSSTIEQQLMDYGFDSQQTRRLQVYLEQKCFIPGDYLIRQQDEATDLFFVQIGQVSIYIELGDNKRVRVQTLTRGTIVGELAFFLDLPRSASVIADENTISYQLTRTALENMKARDPELTIVFNEMMLRLISERLLTTNRELAALNR